MSPCSLLDRLILAMAAGKPKVQASKDEETELGSSNSH